MIKLLKIAMIKAGTNDILQLGNGPTVRKYSRHDSFCLIL